MTFNKGDNSTFLHDHWKQFIKYNIIKCLNIVLLFLKFYQFIFSMYLVFWKFCLNPAILDYRLFSIFYYENHLLKSNFDK